MTEPLRLSREEARALMLAAQGLLHTPTSAPGLDELRAVIERLGVVQIDTISVIERSQYLVLWSRLGAYDPALFDAMLARHRDVFEYWSHAASIVPMSDYRYYRVDMLGAWDDHMWSDLRKWKDDNPHIVQQTLDDIRARGPLASADFERDPTAPRPAAWDWYGPKESRKALDVLWTLGELMISSRRGGQKVYDLRERVLAGALDGALPTDDGTLPTSLEVLHHFVDRTIRALGVVTPSWLWDYFRLRDYYKHAFPNGERGTKRDAAIALLDERVRAKTLLPATVAGLDEPAYVATDRLADLEWLRAGNSPARTTLLTPFDSLIWDRARARALFDYEVCFEAYVLPEKRRYGYYCLAILHQGRIVGRMDLKMFRQERRLVARAVYLEPGVTMDDALIVGLRAALEDLARFLGGDAYHVERSEPAALARSLNAGTRRPRKLPVRALAKRP
ncbi:MAG TPA: crosslink repair DNA glycosylase YcaQ family protein [Ktedonobacterales bacterium]|nr:crosslink repair DNA glycosylase YcaQ family protein [Ktedonobacterales bacterium]